jgi:hypothetical protein
LAESGGSEYGGKSSAHWYDGDGFFELLRAAGTTSVRAMIATLEGCSGAKAGIVAEGFQGKVCNSLSRDEATALLSKARDHSNPVTAKRLGTVGDRSHTFAGYGCRMGDVLLGGRAPAASIPFVIEAWCRPWGETWCRPSSRIPSFHVFINRTPIVNKTRSWLKKGVQTLYDGGQLYKEFKVGNKASFDIQLNITAPYLPITSDGKSPDLSPFADEIVEAVQKAISRARRAMPKADTEVGSP